jgi:hypothetical protein
MSDSMQEGTCYALLKISVYGKNCMDMEDSELIEGLRQQGARQLRETVDRSILQLIDARIESELRNMLEFALKCLHAQSCYDVDEYYSLLFSAFPDARVRPKISMRSDITGDRLTVVWARYWKLQNQRDGRKVYSKVFPKGTRSEKQSMRPFNRQPAELKRIISFMEQRNEIKRKRGMIIAEMLKLLKQYGRVSSEDQY